MLFGLCYVSSIKLEIFPLLYKVFHGNTLGTAEFEILNLKHLWVSFYCSSG